MTRRNFTLAVKKQRLAYVTGEDGVVRCEGCGEIVRRGQYEFDHHLADWLGGKPTFDNCRVLCKAKCHQRKTALDKKLSAKSARVQAAEIGAALPTARPLQSRGFQRTAKREKYSADRLPIPPRHEDYMGSFKIEDIKQ